MENDRIRPYEAPFHYDGFGAKVFDGNRSLALDVRGYGMLIGHGLGGCRLPDDVATTVQDAFGQFVVRMLNEHADELRACLVAAQQAAERSEP